MDSVKEIVEKKIKENENDLTNSCILITTGSWLFFFFKNSKEIYFEPINTCRFGKCINAFFIFAFDFIFSYFW